MDSSDLGRLWFRRGIAGLNPIENFTTVALAIAIGHDDAPMIRALGRVRWPGVAPLDYGRVRHLKADVQKRLPTKDEIRSGYLDLVLDLEFETGEHRDAWVEVKVDSPEGRGYDDPEDYQLNVYQAHATREKELTRRPVIFTLSKKELRPLDPAVNTFPIGWLAWKDLATVIEHAHRADKRWADLRRFLAEYGIAPWPIPTGLPKIVPTDYLPVLFAVNAELRRRWPAAGISWRGDSPARLATYATDQFTQTGELIATGGPLTYGLRPVHGHWAWSVAVGTDNYQRVPMEAGTLIGRADEAGLSPGWSKGSTLRSVVEISEPMEGELSDLARTIEWFVHILDEIEEKDLLRDFLDGLAAPPWSRLKQRAEMLGLGNDLADLVVAAREEHLYVGARFVVSTDSVYAVVAPDVKGLRATPVLYLVPTTDPSSGQHHVRVDRAQQNVERLLGVDLTEQRRLFGPATQYVKRGESSAFSDRKLRDFGAIVVERTKSPSPGAGG